MSRRWLRRGLWLLGFAGLWLNVWDDPPLHSDAYLLDVTTETAVIGLITAGPEQVQAKVADPSGAVVAELASDGPRRRHTFAVSGLRPGSEFPFELRSERGERWTGRIRTPAAGDAAPVRFVFLGDSGDQPWWVWLQRTPALHFPARWGWFGDSAAVTQVGKAVAAYRPDFLLHLGDVIYPKGLHAHYRSGFFRPFAEVLREAPIYGVLGNHDVMESGGVQFLRNLRPSPIGGRGDGRNFSFARGPVRIIGLDCNTDYTGELFDAGHPSAVFLAAELAICDEPWIVVASHFPMRSASRQRDNGKLLLGLLPELARHQVNLYLSGHDHCYQHFHARGDEPPLVSSGGGGKDLYEIRPDPRASKLVSAYHWCSAEVRGAELRVVAHALDGAVLDEFLVPLPTGEDLARLREKLPTRARRIELLGR